MELDWVLQPKQHDTFLTTSTETLYGGAMGSGKSHLMRVASIIWCLQIPYLQVYLFRRTSPELVSNHINGATGYLSLLDPLIQNKLVKVNMSSKRC